MSLVTNQNAIEVSPNRYTAEASTLGLKPGQWPSLLTTALGTGQHLVLSKLHRGPDGDLWWGLYEQVVGDTVLTVFND